MGWISFDPNAGKIDKCPKWREIQDPLNLERASGA
jgi:hypothetical protein